MSTSPRRRVLVSVESDASLDELRAAVALRLGSALTKAPLFLGNSEAAIRCAADLRDGDSIRVELPVDEAPSSSGAAHIVLRLLITAVIFVVLFESLQRLVIRPFFRPDLLTGTPDD